MCSQQALKAKPTPLHLRVFLSSPSDVTDERNLARRLLKDELPYDPLLRHPLTRDLLVTFDVVSWDDPAASTPMPATLTPQEAVNRALPKPSECDFVIIILWSRLGTPLPTEYCKPTGEPYQSGTEWEYEDACTARPQPEILVYRRLEKPKVEVDDPKLEEKSRQYRLVEQFFGRFKNKDGSLQGGVSTYAGPTDFKEHLGNDLKALVRRQLAQASQALHKPSENDTGDWTGSPYPGLRAFTFEEATIFFGRGRETDALIARLRDLDQRFLAVVGASGTGKSSLVRAGLLPRLVEGAIEGSQHWCVLTITPRAIHGDPFLALAVKLEPTLPPGARKGEGAMATVLATAPQRITDYAAMILAGRPAGAALVLVIDQLEELFTLATAAHRRAFIDLLTHAVGDARLRVLSTLRADFLSQCMAEPKLAALLQGAAGTFPLGPPGPLALADMIRKPAERAALDIEEDLVGEILKDAGADPGVLPLVAFCLEALYRRTTPEHHLTVAAYEDLGRLRGAIGQQADTLLAGLRQTEGAPVDTALPQLFRALVHVDAGGTATRRRAFREELGTEPPMPRLVEALVQGRLLVAEGIGGRAIVTLAHEVLLAVWPDLCEWLDHHRAQIQRLQRWLLSLTSPDAMDRRRATEALGDMGPVEPEVVPALITALGDADEEVRRGAAAALERIGPAAAEAVPALITALGDANGDVRRGAAAALGQIGPAAAAAVPALITALGHADSDLRRRAVEVLGKIGPAAVPALITALGDADEKVRRGTATALGRIGPAAAAAVPALITALGDAESRVRWTATKALGQIGPAAVPALTAALENPDKKITQAANAALEWMRAASPDSSPNEPSCA